jgi:eukaryotic-like serine/threonine-protein kinase
MTGPTQDRRIAHRYALKAARGQSGFGKTWQAQDTLLGRQVEIRELGLPPWLAEAERRAAMASAMRELGAVARLNHPGIVTLFDVVNDHDEIFIVTEPLQGPTLADLVRAEGPLPPLRVAELGAQLATVLEVAHSAGIVHRDLNPANVMVRGDGGVRLAGFGLTPRHSAQPLATTAVAIGSPSYVAPEQARGRPSGPAADLWALAATMYFAVEGAPPFDNGTLVGTLAAVVNEDPRPALRAGPLATLLTGLLTKNPDDRIPAAKVRVWLRWLVDVAHQAPPPEALPTQGLGSTIPHPPAPPPPVPQPAKTPTAAMATATTGPLELPATDPATAASQDPPAEPSPAQSEADPTLRPAPSAHRHGWRWLAGVLAVLVVVGVLTVAFPSDPPGDGAAPARTTANAGVNPVQKRVAPASTQSGVARTGTTQPAVSTTKRSVATQAPTTATAAVDGRLPTGWRAFTNRAGNNRVGVPPGFRVRTRQRYHAAVVEEQGGARRLFTVRSQTPSAQLPQASRDYRAWARRNFDGFREVRYAEDQTYAGRRGAVVFEYEAVRDGRRVHVSHTNFKGRSWGYNVELIVPADQWDASQELARQFEQAFRPLG